ncbi:DUF5606 domain-containing protein [Pontibacter sp. 172403-2]|uniref:DUF5606 family protein n=1 Tax=Pontibacter rufus TaxID=2791028 RepID=UPI0018AFE933|nr:DUF5606 domain-containing protein [Pontibacter sp. 172403-2]MBF9252358.1 DUF5606 domain-containing protein [Pontibacter sp. 172403-2]
MPIDLKQVAAISGMSGLYRIVKPTRTGVIIESLEETPRSLVAQARHRMSLLDEISIYTTDEEGTIALAEVFDRLHDKYGDSLPVSEKPDNDELKRFMEEALPEYDESRVYVSDMKKLVSWYAIVNRFVGFTEAEKAAAPEAKETEEAKKAE